MQQKQLFLYFCLLFVQNQWINTTALGTESNLIDVETLQTSCTKNIAHADELVDTSKAIDVNVTLTLLNVNFEDDTRMQAKITALLNQEWMDSRVGDNDETIERAVNGKIWQPFITLIDGELLNTYEEDKTQFWRGSANGHVQYSTKLTFEVQCSRFFAYYPFDVQECLVKFGTYRFPMNEVSLKWPKNPIEIQTALQLHQFELINIETYSEVDIRQSGSFSVLVAKLTIKRSNGRIILQKFVPPTLLLIFSYTTLWFPSNELNDIRFGISIISTILQILLYGLSTNLDYITKLTALDVWILGCLSLSFYTFMHSLLIYFLKMLSVAPSAPPPSSIEFERRKFTQATTKSKATVATWLDNIMKILFPTVCFCMIVVYCAVYVTRKQ